MLSGPSVEEVFIASGRKLSLRSGLILNTFIETAHVMLSADASGPNAMSYRVCA